MAEPDIAPAENTLLTMLNHLQRYVGEEARIEFPAPLQWRNGFRTQTVSVRAMDALYSIVRLVCESAKQHKVRLEGELAAIDNHLVTLQTAHDDLTILGDLDISDEMKARIVADIRVRVAHSRVATVTTEMDVKELGGCLVVSLGDGVPASPTPETPVKNQGRAIAVAKLTPEQRSEIARKAARKRWGKNEETVQALPVEG